MKKNKKRGCFVYDDVNRLIYNKFQSFFCFTIDEAIFYAYNIWKKNSELNDKIISLKIILTFKKSDKQTF